MSLINAIKVGGLKAADWLNVHHDPFLSFKRPAQPKTTETLAIKCSRFEDDIYANFLVRNGTIFNYRIPLPVGSPLDLGDQALWHGIACFTEALKYTQTQSEASKALLGQYLQGLGDQQPWGHLVRGVGTTGITATDASNDQATGHLLGLYGMWFWAPDTLRMRLSELIDAWAYRILTAGHAMTNPDGTVATYGQLIQGWKTDPLRLTLCLAIYACAYAMTDKEIYNKAYNDLVYQYGSLVPYAKAKLLWWDTVYDTHRAAIHLVILNKLKPAPAPAAGLQRISDMVSKQGNIWVNALCAWGLGLEASYDRDQALKVLSEFDFSAKRYNIGIVNSGRQDIDKTVWNGEWVSRQPLPRWQVSSQDFFWQRDLYSINFRSQGSPADSRYSGLDYVAAYRLSLLNGTLEAND